MCASDCGVRRTEGASLHHLRHPRYHDASLTEVPRGRAQAVSTSKKARDDRLRSQKPGINACREVKVEVLTLTPKLENPRSTPESDVHHIRLPTNLRMAGRGSDVGSSSLGLHQELDP